MKRGRQAASPPLVISARTRTLRAARWELLRSGLLIAPLTAPARGDTASPTPLHEAGGTGGTAPRSAASHPSAGTHRGGSFARRFLGRPLCPAHQPGHPLVSTYSSVEQPEGCGYPLWGRDTPAFALPAHPVGSAWRAPGDPNQHPAGPQCPGTPTPAPPCSHSGAETPPPRRALRAPATRAGTGAWIGTGTGDTGTDRDRVWDPLPGPVEAPPRGGVAKHEGGVPTALPKPMGRPGGEYQCAAGQWGRSHAVNSLGARGGAEQRCRRRGERSRAPRTALPPARSGPPPVPGPGPPWRRPWTRAPCPPSPPSPTCCRWRSARPICST